MTNRVHEPYGWVRKGEVAPSDFLRKVVQKGGKWFDGTLEDVAALVVENFSNQEPGTGSVDGDVLLVRVPPEGFYTNIVPISERNAHEIETLWEVRVEGEMPRSKQVIRSFERERAALVKVVIYRADVLARDNDRSSEAEWEMVAVLAQPRENIPMNPSTMLRNYRNLPGGTYREYSAEEWAEAYEFWSTHVTVTDPEEI